MWSNRRAIKTENEEKNNFVGIDPYENVERARLPKDLTRKTLSNSIYSQSRCSRNIIDHGPYKNGCIKERRSRGSYIRGGKWINESGIEDGIIEFYIANKTAQKIETSVILRIDEAELETNYIVMADEVFYIVLEYEDRTVLHRFNFWGQEEAVLEFDQRIIDKIIPVKNTSEFLVRDEVYKNYKLYNENGELLTYIDLPSIKQAMSTSYYYIFGVMESIFITNKNGIVDKALDFAEMISLVGVFPDNSFMVDVMGIGHVFDELGNILYTVEIQDGTNPRSFVTEKIINEYISPDEFISKLLITFPNGQMLTRIIDR